MGQTPPPRRPVGLDLLAGPLFNRPPERVHYGGGLPVAPIDQNLIPVIEARVRGLPDPCERGGGRCAADLTPCGPPLDYGDAFRAEFMGTYDGQSAQRVPVFGLNATTRAYGMPARPMRLLR